MPSSCHGNKGPARCGQRGRHLHGVVARTYFGRVTKAHILAAVREAVGDEAADRIATMKKQPMAEAAEPLLVGTGWLPPLLRTAWPGSTLAPEGSNASSAAFGTDEPDPYLGEIVLPDAAE